MRYVIELTQQQADKITRLVNLGKYSGTAQFVLTAIENQLYIEEDGKVENTITKSDLNSKIKITTRENDQAGSPVVDIQLSPSLTEVRNNKVKVNPPLKFEDLAYSFKRGNSIVEADAWLWGQVNRIFPVKLGLRVLLASLGKEENTEFESFRNLAGNVALAYGRMLRSYERHEDKPREERVSAGLPIDISDSAYRESVVAMLRKTKQAGDVDSYIKQEEFKSTNRYKAHFLAFLRKDGKLEGAMAYLKFINVRKAENGKVLIGLTKEGLEFTALKNPIIDEKRFDQSLSDKEKEYYLEHITKNVKGEYTAIRWMLKIIEAGKNRRQLINLHLKEDWNSKWGDSDEVINTQRAGLMARMFELGLLNKEKQGIEVTYSVSENGKAFLENG